MGFVYLLEGGEWRGAVPSCAHATKPAPVRCHGQPGPCQPSLSPPVSRDVFLPPAKPQYSWARVTRWGNGSFGFSSFACAGVATATAWPRRMPHRRTPSCGINDVVISEALPRRHHSQCAPGCSRGGAGGPAPAPLLRLLVTDSDAGLTSVPGAVLVTALRSPLRTNPLSVLFSPRSEVREAAPGSPSPSGERSPQPGPCPPLDSDDEFGPNCWGSIPL